jgi:NAD(P)-dependent dehydrogenase (short-subunit alcohol dehydrogenase family)
MHPTVSVGAMVEANVHATRHEGRVAIVTGAASGIGRATVLRLAAEGARVVGCDLDAGGLDGTSKEAPDGRVVTEVADITSPEDVERVMARADDTFGRVDTLANVAGILDNMLPPHDIDDATWERVMRVNVDGPMRLTRAVLPRMRSNGGGAIVNVASEASLRGGTAGVAYTTSKHAVLGLTRSVAWFYGPERVRCNAVVPGGVATNIGASLDSRKRVGARAGHARGRHRSPHRRARPDRHPHLLAGQRRGHQREWRRHRRRRRLVGGLTRRASSHPEVRRCEGWHAITASGRGRGDR